MESLQLDSEFVVVHDGKICTLNVQLAAHNSMVSVTEKHNH